MKLWRVRIDKRDGIRAVEYLIAADTEGEAQHWALVRYGGEWGSQVDGPTAEEIHLPQDLHILCEHRLSKNTREWIVKRGEAEAQ